MPLEDLQRELARIIETAPTLPDSGPIPPDYMQWAADAYALIVATGLIPLQPEAQVAINGLTFANRVTKREQLMMILHKARSQIELEIRQSGKGQPTGPTGPAISHNSYPRGLNGPSGPSPYLDTPLPLRPETNPANWPRPHYQPTGRPTARLEELISPYYLRDPRPSELDPRTSHMGFRPQPDGNVQAAPITGVQATAGVGEISFPQTTEAKLEELAAKIALLEAALANPKPPGMGAQSRSRPGKCTAG
jgi:hypothetical protein